VTARPGAGAPQRGPAARTAPATPARPRKRVTDAPGQPPLGAHVSTAGGMAMAPARADQIGATAMQVFTKTPNQWKEPVIGPADAAGFRAALAASGVRFTTAHDSYLINLASPDKVIRKRSVGSFGRELARCNVLRLDALVSHPGNFIDDRASGIARNADGITQALEAHPGPTRLLMEGTAGQGTVIGSTFEELARLLKLVPARLRRRIGICLDTCHLYAAGYDLVRDYDGVWARFDDVLGLDHLGCIHLNDSMTPFNSHRDRHALIGAGSLGREPFRRIMNDQRLSRVPKVLETPKGDDLMANDRRMLRMLRGFVAER
jgi:deoxyribonuclease-4